MVMSSDTSDVALSFPMPHRWVWASALVAGLALVGSVTILFLQATVTNDVDTATRTCGSAFDTFADRSGWDVWWARDLDEPDSSLRTALIRTNLCPSAINQRIVLASILGAFGVLSAILARRAAIGGRDRPPGTSVVGRADRVAAGQIARLGRATSWSGALLSIAGAGAVVLLVADADSTLFLYVDRFVVVIVGLIVLMPTMALFVIGRSLVLLARYLPQHKTAPDRDDV